ncbi:MAG: hypothetical protein K2L11_08915, partial [Muribaculaceae bacterium]|nr:hypothetical protein [Muribaculaceae bacterium]
MKSTAKISKLTLLLTVSIMMTGAFSCEHPDNTPEVPSEISEINDLLRSGEVARAVHMTDLLKKRALSEGDSALWSEAMVQQGINAYYQGKPALVLASSDTAINWIERQKPSPARARILAKAYQTHGAYYDQFHFNADSSIYYLRKAVENVELSRVRSDLPQAYGNYANALRMGASLDSAA